MMPKKKQENEQEGKEKVKAMLFQESLLCEMSDAARELFNQSRYGSIEEDGRYLLSRIESLYLMEKGKLEIRDGKNHIMDPKTFIKKSIRHDPNFMTRYAVFKDLRNRGYIVKTALKFGADFRVYDRGVKPGEDHAMWVVFPVKEDAALTWYDFAAKNRVAHSTKKRLLLGVVDDEADVSYWECRWVRP